MRYTVRNQDGEIHFGNYLEMEHAWLAGLVEPEDEVHEEGKDGWVKAGQHAMLIKARPPAKPRALGGLLRWLLGSLVLAGVALYMLLRGNWSVGLALALILSALLSVVTYKTFGKKP
jgi:hypothetical protein